MRKKQRIGILIDRLNVGGVEKIALEQVIALRKRGEDAYLLVLREKAVVENAFPDLVRKVQIVYLDKRLPKFFRFSFQFPVFHFFSLFHISYPFLIPFILKKNEFDYLIVHGTYTSFTAFTIKKLKKISYSVFIWDPIGYILKRVYASKFPKLIFTFLFYISRILDGMIIKNADVLLVGGDAHNAYLRTFSKTKPIIEISPSVHSIQSINKKKENYVLMVTAWKRGKDPEFLFEIVKEMPAIKIKMVGKWLDPEYRKLFETQIVEKNMQKNIEVVGEVTEKELSDYYIKALVVLQTNDDRGFGMPALEAAGHGTTFIIPKGQGVCKLFINGKDGYYTREKDRREISELLKRLFKSPIKARALGNHGLQTVILKYSWQKHAEHLMEVVAKYAK